MKRGLFGCAARDGSSTSSRRRSIAPMSLLKSLAAWITASTRGSLPAHRSGDAISPAIGVAPRSAKLRRSGVGSRQTADIMSAPDEFSHHGGDRKSTRLNSSHDQISYAVFCLKKKKK